jgi:hypothetical protein
MKKWVIGLIIALPLVAYAQAANVPVSDWVLQLWGVIKEFIGGGVSWQVKVAGILALIMTSMRVTFIYDLFWAKLGALTPWVGPALGLVLGVLNALIGGGHWSDVWSYVTAGAGAIIIHDLLDLVKLIPGIGPMWVNLINIIENMPLVGKDQKVVVDNQLLLAVGDTILEGAELIAAQLIWAEILIAAPWLTTPIIGPAISWLYFQLWKWFGAKSVSFMNFFLLGYAVNKQKQAYDAAVANLKQALANQQGDPNALQKASDDFDSALQGLVQTDVPGGPAK